MPRKVLRFSLTHLLSAQYIHTFTESTYWTLPRSTWTHWRSVHVPDTSILTTGLYPVLPSMRSVSGFPPTGGLLDDIFTCSTGKIFL